MDFNIPLPFHSFLLHRALNISQVPQFKVYLGQTEDK